MGNVELFPPLFFFYLSILLEGLEVSPSQHRVGSGEVVMKIQRGRVCIFFFFKWMIFREK